MFSRFRRFTVPRCGGVLVSTAFALLLLSPEPALALTPSGKTVAVIQATSATGPGGSRTLAPAKPVFSGDRIRTGGSGEAQIVFADDTRLVVGPNSSIVIDKYVYNPRTGVEVGMQLAKGAFRFISGPGKKRSFQIATPTATLGVRGTAFDVGVTAAATAVAVFEGAVQSCSRQSGACTLVTSGCNIAVVTRNGRIGSPASQADKAALIRTSFPLIERQRQFRSGFRVDARSCGSTRATRTPRENNVRQINLAPASEEPEKPEKPEKPRRHKHHKDSKHHSKSGHHSKSDHGAGQRESHREHSHAGSRDRGKGKGKGKGKSKGKGKGKSGKRDRNR